MPWSGSEFKARHNHSLSGPQAAHASKVANAILKRTGDEGLAIATANAREKRATGGAVKETKAAAQYTVQGTKSEHCSICEHYQRPNGCAKVTGTIAAGGWCKLFDLGLKRADGGDIPDESGNYNTQLTPVGDALYRQQMSGRAGDTSDYDLRGAWASSGGGPPAAGHMPDTFKKPNHPTFSTGSIYANGGNEAGVWTKMPSGNWAFMPGATNRQTYGTGNLQRYFDQREPGNLLLGRSRGGTLHRADGGDTLADTSTQGSGLFPTSGTQDPQSQQMIQRFSGMPLEGLQEAVIRMGPDSPMGRLAARVLQQKRAMPTSQSMGFGGGGGRGMPRPPAPGQQEDTLQPGLSALRQGVQGFGGDGQGQAEGYAPGGMIKPPALGMGMMEPPWTRSAMRPASMPTSGFLHGATPGRADSIKTATLPNSFVIPADVVSGLGEGNSLAGAHALQMAMSTGPHGVPLPRGGGGRGLPRPPAAPHFTRGGKIDHVPVALSDGEFVINPEQVAAIGGGDIKRGFKVLEAFVVHARKKAIAKLKRLPGPVKS